MKLAFIMSDAGAALHVGGQVSTTTHVVEIPDALLPLRVKQYLEGKDRPGCYWSMAISLVDESESKVSVESPGAFCASLFERLAKRPASDDATAGDSPHDMLHRLWSSCVDKPGYDKEAWREIERQLKEAGVYDS